MSFTGDLEHLPIVDILQLLHATRKSGILRINSRKGESHLVFKEGYIVSANHLNNRVRIGNILVTRGAISPEILEKALQDQEELGAMRRPLIVTLLDKGLVNEEEAYRGLEELIEMTVVEILTWKRGTFVLDVESGQTTDSYRYYPAKIDREINVDTQGVLMDSLRIFDEKLRDGEITEEEDISDEGSFPAGSGVTPAGSSLTADDLGLADLEQLERKIPGVFTGLADHDPARVHRQKLLETGALLPPEKVDKLVEFLEKFPAIEENRIPVDRQSCALVFFSPDPTLQHAVTTVCKNAGIPVFATNDALDLEPILERSLSINSQPLLVIDSPAFAEGSFSPERTGLLRRLYRERFPQMSIVQLSPPRDEQFMLQAYDDGVRAVLPRPAQDVTAETYVADIIRFLPTLRSYVMECVAEHRHPCAAGVRVYLNDLREAREIPETALAVLKVTAGIFERALTLVVRGRELIVERGIGIKPGTDRTPSPVPGIHIPLEGSQLLQRVIDTGRIHYGRTGDTALKDHLHAAIGAPYRSSVLLLPLKMRGKTIALTYGDFGSRELSPVDIDLLEILASQAELVLENATFRKKLEKTPVKG